jgi:hypothetical protein
MENLNDSLQEMQDGEAERQNQLQPRIVQSGELLQMASPFRPVARPSTCTLRRKWHL